MKKSILFSLLVAFSFLSFTSCSSDDDSSSNSTSHKIHGKWGTIGGDDITYLRFNFRSDKKVEYFVYWDWDVGPELEEIGSWSMDGDILTMVFSEEVELIFEQRVIFIDNDTMEFVEVPGSEHEAWADTYVRIE